MAGRNGPDNLTIFSFVTALVINSFAAFFNIDVLKYASILLIIYCIFRMLSKNTVKRRAESDKFMLIFEPVKQWAAQKIVQIRSSKTHKFFKCPSCKNILRVPRGKGKIHITCPKCGQRFDGKT
jgi:IBR domain.